MPAAEAVPANPNQEAINRARSEESQRQRTTRTMKKKIQKYMEHVDVYQADVTLEELQKAKSKTKFKSVMEENSKALLDEGPTRPFSTKILDRNGRPIFFYVGLRWKEKEGTNASREPVRPSTPLTNQILIHMKKKPIPLKKIYDERTEEVLNKGLAEGKQVVHDGLDVASFTTPVLS